MTGIMNFSEICGSGTVVNRTLRFEKCGENGQHGEAAANEANSLLCCKLMRFLQFSALASILLKHAQVHSGGNRIGDIQCPIQL